MDQKVIVHHHTAGQPCFRCRTLVPARQGDWFTWQRREVYLCASCAEATQKQPSLANAAQRPRNRAA